MLGNTPSRCQPPDVRQGMLSTLDIEPEMLDSVRQKAVTFDLPNIQSDVRDFVAYGTGVESESQAHAMIFNLLHLEHPVDLLSEAYRTLHDGGVLSVIHLSLPIWEQASRSLPGPWCRNRGWIS